MRNLMLAASAAILSTSALASETVPLQLKPGLWETKTSVKVTLDPAAAEGLSPAEKAAIASGQTETGTECLTADDIAKGPVADMKGEGCTAEIAESTPAKLTATIKCGAGSPNPQTSEIAFEAPTPETMKGTIKMVSPGEGSMDMTMEGSWKAEACPAESAPQ